MWWAKNREIEFLAPGALLGDLDPATVERSDFRPTAPLVFSADRAPLAQHIQHRFPEGRLEAHAGNSPGEVAFYLFFPKG